MPRLPQLQGGERRMESRLKIRSQSPIAEPSPMRSAKLRLHHHSTQAPKFPSRAAGTTRRRLHTAKMGGPNLEVFKVRKKCFYNVLRIRCKSDYINSSHCTPPTLSRMH
jgi:hypothetical protein